MANEVVSSFIFLLFLSVSNIVDAQCSGGLAKYVDALPIPSVLNSSSITITISEFTQQLHRDMPPTRLWGYQQTYPGPTIEVWSGENLTVTWVNKLPLTNPVVDVPNATATIVHLHGGHVPEESDGYPLNFFFPGGEHTDTYPNAQNATMLWYHDHTFANTRINVYFGMAGFYIIRDSFEISLQLPYGQYEIPIVIQDRLIDPSSGQLQYPNVYPPDPNFIGDTILANGKVWPYVKVEPTLYRLRYLNGANGRTFNLSLSNGALFTVIGGDQGFLPKAVETAWILLMPAERVDVLFDFSQFTNQKIVLENSAPAPNFPGGNAPDPCTDGVVLQFVVGGTVSCGEMCGTVPKELRPKPIFDMNAVSVVRNITLEDWQGGFLLNGATFEDPITEIPVLGQFEIWNFISTTDMAHPLHIHLTHFYLLARQSHSSAYIEQPLPTELGPKDTVRVDPHSTTSVLVQFTDYTGLFVYHCHMLEHEDYMMMRPFEVISGNNWEGLN